MALGIETKGKQTLLLTAFDIDGVLVPDCDHFPNIGGLDEFYALTSKMVPIFTPSTDYILITARHAKYRATTWAWCKEYMDPLPIQLFHECTDETAGDYKAKVLNANPSIKRYIESDLSIVTYLRKNVTTGCEIIHFESFMQLTLNH